MKGGMSLQWPSAVVPATKGMSLAAGMGRRAEPSSRTGTGRPAHIGAVVAGLDDQFHESCQLS